MEINIIIKGGVELEKFYPKKYETFMKDLPEMVMQAFPGVDGCLIDTKLTDRHKAEQEKREAMRREELKQEISLLMEDPVFLEKMRNRFVERGGSSCPK